MVLRPRFDGLNIVDLRLPIFASSLSIIIM
jgi:hypothetical protein